MNGELMQGVWPATATFFDDDGTLLTDRFAEHCSWLVDSGCDGVVVNGSLGEYEALDDDERVAVVTTAAEAVGADRVVPGVSGKSAEEALRWARQAADVGCPAVMCLPPTSHAPTAEETVAHFARVADAGLPIIAYNNPFSTRVDLTPDLVARIHQEVPSVEAVKEFSTDVRRVLRILDEAPGVQVVCGCDDVIVESVAVGARGWIAGFVNAFPEQSVTLYRLAVGGRLDEALVLYREMLPALRWDADPRFIQAIKLALDMQGRYGGPCRLPRLGLPPDDEARVKRDVERALEAGTG